MNSRITKMKNSGWAVAFWTVLVAMVFSACQDDMSDSRVMATTPKLTSTVADGESIELGEDQSANQALYLSWTAASNEGTNAGITYSLQFDNTEAADFATPFSIDLGKSVSTKSYTVGELNGFMVTVMGIEVDETATVHVRVKAVVIGQDLEPAYSNAISFSATTYDATELQPPYKKLFIVGGATPGGWNIDSPDSMRRDASDHFIFRFGDVFTVDDFKIPTTTGNWDCDYYMPMTAAGDITSTDVQLVPGGSPDYKWHIPTAGAYKITLDLRATKIYINPFTPFTQLWMVGDATPAGWNIDSPTPMVADGVDPNIFKYEGPLNAGEFKIPTATGNWGGNFFMPAIDHQPLSETAASYVVGGSPDKKWQVTEAGNYRIIFNQLKETIKITKL